MIVKCCMCNNTKGALNIVRNPWGDAHIVCTFCVSKWKIFWAEGEEE